MTDQYKFMMEAFRYVFKKIPPTIDSPLLRKNIADAMLKADDRNAPLADVRNAGLAVLNDVFVPAANY